MSEIPGETGVIQRREGVSVPEAASLTNLSELTQLISSFIVVYRDELKSATDERSLVQIGEEDEKRLKKTLSDLSKLDTVIAEIHDKPGNYTFTETRTGTIDRQGHQRAVLVVEIGPKDPVTKKPRRLPNDEKNAQARLRIAADLEFEDETEPQSDQSELYTRSAEEAAFRRRPSNTVIFSTRQYYYDGHRPRWNNGAGAALVQSPIDLTVDVQGVTFEGINGVPHFAPLPDTARHPSEFEDTIQLLEQATAHRPKTSK